MKLSKRTLDILKNFSSISDRMWFRNEGFLVSVIPQHYNLIAKATIEETFDDEFGIFDLKRFLGVLSLFDYEKYEMKLVDKVLTITEGNQKLKYVTCQKNVLDLGPRNHPEIKGAKMPASLAEFELKENILKKTLSVVNVMSTFNQIGIKSEDGFIVVYATNTKDPTSDLFSYKAGETDSTFNLQFKCELFEKLINDDYQVKVAKGIVEFTGKMITYYLTPESTSSYD